MDLATRMQFEIEKMKVGFECPMGVGANMVLGMLLFAPKAGR